MSKYKRITNDQWEGLQFELSELKSEMVQALEKLGIPLEDGKDFLDEVVEERKKPRGGLGSGPNNLSEMSTGYAFSELKDSEFEYTVNFEAKDWGMDAKWQVRKPLEVTLVDGPSNLVFGPFVLTTPEERALILKNWSKKKAALKTKETEQKYLLDRIRQLEAELKREQTRVSFSTKKIGELVDDLADADQTIEQLVSEAEKKEQEYQVINAKLDQAQSHIDFLRNARETTHSEGGRWSRMVEEGPE